MQCFEAAYRAPLQPHDRILEKSFEQGLVVALERDVGRREWIVG